MMQHEMQTQIQCNAAVVCAVSEDIMWFKSVELRTKLNRRGRILEPIGKLLLVSGIQVWKESCCVEQNNVQIPYLRSTCQGYRCG